MTKCVIEFGIKKSRHCDNAVLSCNKYQAEYLASQIAFVFGASRPEFDRSFWNLSKYKDRITWVSNTHFVALSRLTDEPRGCASAHLW